MKAASVKVTALALSSSYFFSSAVVVLTTETDQAAVVDVAANNSFITGRFSTIADTQTGDLLVPLFHFVVLICYTFYPDIPFILTASILFYTG